MDFTIVSDIWGLLSFELFENWGIIDKNTQIYLKKQKWNASKKRNAIRYKLGMIKVVPFCMSGFFR